MLLQFLMEEALNLKDLVLGPSAWGFQRIGMRRNNQLHVEIDLR